MTNDRSLLTEIFLGFIFQRDAGRPGVGEIEQLMAAVPVSHPDLRQPRPLLGGDMPSPSRPPSGCRFHTRCPHARALCKEAVPVMETVEAERQVACHFWREIANAGSATLILPTPSAAYTQRLNLFKHHQSLAVERTVKP
ncbi:Dipeptide/oligopeptide/nickel ABC-type transport system [Pseudomonas savastanoi pv. glycinea]|nr:Dipeptide/oligopeptide/nickel ABC-type transport system [Pseudomonas savastanoi pv. glycinea]RML88196.1 Dipeptide/oligopeptide/nickel ABC-type transport system [Pseudomonas savastanoi pv. glycinea]